MKGPMLRITKEAIRSEIERTQKHLTRLKKALKCKHEKFNPPLEVYNTSTHRCVECGWKIYT